MDQSQPRMDGTVRGLYPYERTKNSASSLELGPETARVIIRHTHKPLPKRYCLGRQNSFQFIDKILNMFLMFINLNYLRKINRIIQINTYISWSTFREK